MAWPSSTKAPTTNVDAGSDRPALARADIKQNIDNVNNIIDTFDIASPSNGDILVYNSTSGAWEPGAPSSGGASIGILNISSGQELVTSNTYRRTVSIDFDTFNFLTQNGSYQITVSPGTYIFEPIIQSTEESEVDIYLHDETSDVDLGVIGGMNDLGGTTTFIMVTGFRSATFGSNTNISFRQTSANSANRNINCRIKVTKI
jgi:hypothetical protein